MRELGARTPAWQTSLTTQIKNVMNEYDKSPFNPVLYQTISGKVEGVFGWVAANYTVGANTFPSDAAVNAGRGHNYLEMGGQTMQLALCTTVHPAGNPVPPLRIKIGPRLYELLAHCWEDRGADAVWRKHLDNLYGPAHPPNGVRGVLPASATANNCLPKDAHDPKLVDYPASGRFIECIHDCLWLAGSHHQVGSTMNVRQPGFLIREHLPAESRNSVNAQTHWVGTATFYYGPRGVFLNPTTSVNTITLFQEASQVHTTSYAASRQAMLDAATAEIASANSTENEADKARYRGSAAAHQDASNYLWRAIFNAVYTSVTLHNGFGFKFILANAGNTTARTNLISEIYNALPGEQRNLRDTLTQFLDRSITDAPGQQNAKTYTIIDPDTKPWAMGAALVWACNGDNIFKPLVEV